MRLTGLLIIVVFVLTACGQAPTPVATPNIQQTVEVVSSTMIAETLTAQPTSSPVPTTTPLPTETATASPTETYTPDPVSLTLVPPAIGPTETPWSGTLSPGNTDGLPKGFLRIENNTGVKEITFTMTGITLTREQPVYLAYKVTGALNLVILWGRYDYVIQVPGKIIFKGKFTQNNKDKTTIRVFANKVVIVGP